MSADGSAGPAPDLATIPLTAAAVAEAAHDRAGIFLDLPGRPAEAGPLLLWIEAPDLSLGERHDLANNIARRLNRDAATLPPR